MTSSRASLDSSLVTPQPLRLDRSSVRTSARQSYIPGMEKYRFPEQRKAAFLPRDLWRALARLAAAMSRSVVNILADS